MAKSKHKSTKPKSKATSKKKRVRKGIPLKRYNKILSTVIKDYKKKGVSYDIKEVRKGVSAIYPKYRDIAPSRISVKSVKEDFINVSIAPIETEPKEDTFRIQATDVPRYWFDMPFPWFRLDMYLIDFNEAYPEIPIVIKTAQNELRIKGSIGPYVGSVLQEFVEELRKEFEDQSAYNGNFQGNPAWEERKDKQYAFWGTLDAELPPNMITDYEELDREIEEIVEQREEGLKEKKKAEKKAKQEARKLEKSKDKKAKPTEKKKSEPKKSETSEKIRLAELREKTLEIYRDMEKDLRADYKDGIYTKSEFKQELMDLKKERKEQLAKYEKGGIV